LSLDHGRQPASSQSFPDCVDQPVGDRWLSGDRLNRLILWVVAEEREVA